MKKIVLFGAGKSSSVLIGYLLSQAKENEWKIIIADANKKLILEKTGNDPHSEAIELDIQDADKRGKLINEADIVISMMPPHLHIQIARDCITYSKHLLTASYADQEIKSLEKEVASKNLLFLCEMGLDPGIDHMSAMQLLDEIKSAGGTIISFKSHCGGLIAPESDDNPWHYKVTWNPRNIVLAGKSGAVYKENGNIVSEVYEELFNPDRSIKTGNVDVPELSFYPNRDSLPYISLYGLEDADTFIRTTLRYREFMNGWKNIVDLKLTDEEVSYNTSGLSLKTFYKEMIFKNENKEKLPDIFAQPGITTETETVSDNLTKSQFIYLGLNDDHTFINKELSTAADVLQIALEQKLALKPEDKDMIVMLHEIDYLLKGKRHSIHSSLFVKGENSLHTAMAKTVGLPLGIAAKLILNGTITLTGIHIPILRVIYKPLLKELKDHGIIFMESRS